MGSYIEVKDYASTINLISAAMLKLSRAISEKETETSKKIHTHLSGLKVYFFFKRFKNLPEPTAENFHSLLVLANKVGFGHSR
jgi:uncharacterized protein YoxC